MYKIEVSLGDLVDNINFLMEKELEFVGTRNGKAAWIAGNHLITARRVTDRLSEFEMVNALRIPIDADQEASLKWRRFVDKLARNVGEIQEVPDFERVAGKTMAVLKLLKTPEGQAELQRSRSLKPEEISKLLQQAGETYLDLHQLVTYIQPSIENIEEVIKYSLDGLTIRDIALKTSLSESSVGRIRKKHGIRKKRR
jgi:hypothetical protein